MHGYILLQIPTGAAESVSEFLAEQPGFLGLEERPATGAALFPADSEHAFIRFDHRQEFDEWLRAEKFRSDDHVRLCVYAETPDIAAWKNALLKSIPGLDCLETGIVEPRDYLAEMRAQHHGRILDKFWVGPPWETPPAGKLPVIIEPGTAFGLGDHPTTQLCLELLANIPAAHRILDFGAGTGVLAIAAARLFPDCQLWLTETDPQCRPNIEHNFSLNNLPTPPILTHSPPGPFDLVLANVYLEILKPLLRLDAARLIASGLLENDQLDEFLESAIPVFAHHRIVRRDRWAAVELWR